MLISIVGTLLPHAVSAAESELAPRWYRLNPVQLHTRLGPLAFERALLKERPDLTPEAAREAIPDIAPMLNAPAELAYQRAGAFAAKLGAGVLVRHVKTGDEPPPWATTVPDDTPAVDLVTPMVEEAHNAGVRMIAYYWHMSDRLAADANPPWICRSRKGPTVGRRGTMLDVTSPFGDMTITRLEELHRLGVDGIYLDGRHMPSSGCRGSALEEAFEEVTGHRWSKATKDRFDAFSADVVQQELASWSSRFRNDPEFAMIVSMARQPNLIDRDAAIDLARVGIPKTEFGIPTRSRTLDAMIEAAPALLQTVPRRSTRIAVALSLLREISKKPPHVWIHRIASEADLIHAVGAVLTHGATANVNVLEPDLGGAATEERRQALEAVFGLNSKLGSLLVDAKPMRFAAVHYSEDARNQVDSAEAWLEVVSPVMHAFAALLEANLPVAVLDDEELASGDLGGFAHLFTPLEEELSESQLENLATHGVAVHALPAAAPDEDLGQLYAETTSVAAPESTTLPLQIQTTDPQAHATIMHIPADNTYLVQVVAPFDHIRTGTRRRGPARKKPSSSAETAALRIALSWFEQVPMCAKDAISDQTLDPDSEGWVSFPEGQAYAAIHVAPC